MLKKLKYLYVLPFVLLAAWVIVIGIAEVFALQAKKYENSWKVSGVVEDKKTWDKAYSNLKMAMALNPYNPWYPESIGRIYIWRYYIKNAPVELVEEVEAISNEGLKYIRLSIDMRPTWLLIYSTEKRLDQAAKRVIAKIKASD